MNGKFYDNNIVIQYDKDLIEVSSDSQTAGVLTPSCTLQVWDEAKRLLCEWYNDYEKDITKPPWT